MTYPVNQPRRRILRVTASLSAAVTTGLLPLSAFAADPLKVGLILPMSGPFASTGKQIEAAVKLYIAQNGATVGS